MNLKVFELFSLKIERRDEKVWDNGIIELKGPKDLLDKWKFEVAGFEIPNVIISKVTRNAEGTKEKVRDSEV